MIEPETTHEVVTTFEPGRVVRCPVCDEPCDSLVSTIAEGQEKHVGPFMLRDNDRIVSAVVKPCGHAVAGWMGDELGNVRLVSEIPT